MLSALLLLAVAQTGDPLAAGFQSPPPSARPHTWWHWMDGNVTKEGITADLEAMKEVGIGGAQMFTVGQGIPKGPVDYNSPKWHEMTAHAIKEANRLGIELCLHNCAGWSSSGGPWITPENAMQVVAWSRLDVKGPRSFNEKLPQPKAPQVYANVDYYRDIACYAMPTTAATAKPDLGRTGVVRADNLDPDLAGLDPNSVPSDKLVLLTSNLMADGTLRWNVPAGNWTILRMGHVPTGKDNHPAPPEGDGLEVDKLSRAAMDTHWAGIMAKVLKDAGPLAGKSLNNALIDSYEVGSQNWTPLFREEFRKRRGYDILPYLPVLAGVTVDSKETSERFLWDMRRTIADLYADNYYGYFGELCHKNGLLFSTEPYGNGGFDNIQAGGLADIPMGEFWVGGYDTLQSTKLASSVGHVYDHQVIGAESFTADDRSGRWIEEPYAAKALGDFVFTKGVNRYIFHRYAQQPWMNLKPGMTMGPWGTHLERTQTWWTEAGEWMKYVARCQYLLQKGTFVADALYFYGEGAPADMAYGAGLKPAMPKGYDYDFCDTTVVMKRITVKDGKLVLPDGMTYRVLVLPDSKFMTPAMAERISELVRAGATVVGPRPEQTPSLSNFNFNQGELQRIAANVWGNVDGRTVKEKTYGQGRVIWGMPLQDVFNSLRAKPDFEYRSVTGGSKLVYIHRQIDGAEVYFVSNQQYQPTEAEVTFRVDGRTPELWHGDSGRMEVAPVFRRDGNRMVVPLRLGPAESVFVVFRRPVSGSNLATFGREGEARVVQKMPVIEVQSARYETADGRGVDVADILNQLIKEGQTEIPATNGLFGDPVLNVVKRLTVTYTVDGKKMTKTVAENETLLLLQLTNAPVPPASYQLERDGGKMVLTPWKTGRYSGTTTSGRTATWDIKEPTQEMKLGGAWTVNFTPGWGAPPTVKLPKLMSWADHSDTGVKYFSGSATYVRDIDVPARMIGDRRAIMLDLGRVKNFATVRLNGRELAILWKEPFVVDLSGRLKAGHNKLEIKVTNLWPNRIIGDEQLPPDVEWNGVQLKKWPDWLLKGQPRPKTGRYTFVTWRFYTKDSPLLESGLIGPVSIRSTKKVVLNGL
jgi:hypothetical protein